MQKRFDNIVFGILVGLAAPVAGMFFYYSFTYRYQVSFSGFIGYFTSIHIIIQAFSLAVYFSNLPVFFLFLWKENNKSARGVLLATVAYTIWVMSEKLL